MNKETVASNMIQDITLKAEQVALYNNTIDTNLRREALDEFVKLGFPTKKHEEWRFTNVNPYLKDLTFPVNEDEPVLNASDLLSEHIARVKNNLKGTEKGVYRLVLVNGIISHELSSLPDLSKGQIGYIESGNDKIGKIAAYKNDAFIALNTALFERVIYIKLPKNYCLDKPIHIIRLYTNQKPVISNERMFIELEEGANLDVIETSYARPDTIVMSNKITEIQLQENAQFNHYDMQKGWQGRRQISKTEVEQKKYSNYSNYTFNFPGGDFYRNNLNIYLEDEDITCHLYGLYMTDKTQLVDNHTEVHHKFPNCQSNQLYKGVMMNKSKAVFNGKIYVYTDAQKTNAFQQSNNILLSEEATIHAKPQLEIFADDVKCSHGTTIGQLDENAIFYLTSRGIGTDTARKMMISAFAYDVAEKIKHPAIRQYVESEIANMMD